MYTIDRSPKVICCNSNYFVLIDTLINKIFQIYFFINSFIPFISIQPLRNTKTVKCFVSNEFCYLLANLIWIEFWSILMDVFICRKRIQVKVPNIRQKKLIYGKSKVLMVKVQVKYRNSKFVDKEHQNQSRCKYLCIIVCFH